MTVDSFIADLKARYGKFDNAGMIDELSVYKWIVEALKPFGSNIMTLQETVLEVSNGVVKLPDSFFSLYVAYKCDPLGYCINSEKNTPQLQQSIMWTERVERSNKWNSCDPCCVEEEEKIIKETLYYNNCEVDFYYKTPRLLKLGKRFQKTNAHKKCRNLIVRDCPYEINIVGKTLQANFEEGDIYMQFYGLPTAEDGKVMIPDTARGELERYVEYYVKLNMFEDILITNPDPNIRSLFEYYVGKEQIQKGNALTDTKFSTLTPNSFNRLRKINRLEMLKYECMFPEL